MKPMTFEQARRKLARIAKGKYHALKYELTIPGKIGGVQFPQEIDCAVYIENTNWYGDRTWAGAFAKLKAGEERREKYPPNRKEQPL